MVLQSCYSHGVIPFFRVNQMGLFMGLFNMFIVIPKIITSLGFGWVMNSVFDNLKLYAILTAGVLLLIAALLTLRIKESAEVI